MLCYVMLCYVMLCYVMLCYVMLCYVMWRGAVRRRGSVYLPPNQNIKCLLSLYAVGNDSFSSSFALLELNDLSTGLICQGVQFLLFNRKRSSIAHSRLYDMLI